MFIQAFSMSPGVLCLSPFSFSLFFSSFLFLLLFCSFQPLSFLSVPFSPFFFFYSLAALNPLFFSLLFFFLFFLFFSSFLFLLLSCSVQPLSFLSNIFFFFSFFLFLSFSPSLLQRPTHFFSFSPFSLFFFFFSSLLFFFFFSHATPSSFATLFFCFPFFLSLSLFLLYDWPF
jgi:hypothetical protein